MGNLSQRTRSATISLFSLHSDIRKEIYNRVLVVAHPLYLFQDTGSGVVETFAPERPFRWLSLLYTNRQIHDEARAVLSGSNQFNLLDTTQQQGGLLQSFLDCITSVNASLLSHLSINFPVIKAIEGQPGKAELGEDDMHSLTLLQEECTNLATLEILIHSENSKHLVDPNQGDSQFIREALSEISTQLGAIPSLKKVIVRSYDRTLTPLVIDFMQGLRWEILPGR